MGGYAGWERGVCEIVRDSSNGGVVWVNPMTTTAYATVYTMEVERYGEWVTYDFMPHGNGKVYTKPSFGPAKTLSTEEARRLWRALLRKGWMLRPEPCIDF